MIAQRYDAADDVPPLESRPPPEGGTHLPLHESLVPAGFPPPADDYVDLKSDVNNCLVRKPCASYIVVVAIDGEFTVKRVRYKGSEVMLHPQNPKYPVIALGRQEDFGFRGVVTGVVRKLCYSY